MRIAILLQKHKTRNTLFIFFTLILSFLTGCEPRLPGTPSATLPEATPTSTVAINTPTVIIREEFNGERAYQDIVFQLSLGPRTPGSVGHTQTREWITREMKDSHWETTLQQGEIMGNPVTNIIAKRGAGSPIVLIGAHYDTRLVADRDANESLRTQPVPGANDGASGVAVLLELARTLPNSIPGQVWLVFFDAEDNGNLPGREWIMGAQLFVNQLVEQPEAEKPEVVIIVDMIGDANLNIHPEKVSDPALTAEIWAQARAIGHGDVFFDDPKHSIIDDHRPFIIAGIPAIDIVDFDYPYWHTTQDSADKVSAESLQVIGETLTAWLLQR